MSEPPASNFDSARYRQVLGHFPTGVTVVTAMDGAEPIGLAIGSFSSLSLDPPLVLFAAGQSSTSWSRIRPIGRFCVNILAEDQEDVCRAFAMRSDDKFEGIGWTHSALGSPIIHGVSAWIDCETHDIVEEGDHDIVVGAVRGLDVEHEGGPLVFYRGGYGRFTS